MFIPVLQDSKDMNKLFSRGNLLSFYLFVCDFNKYLSYSISNLFFHLSLWSHNLFYIQVTSMQHKYAESSICPEKKEVCQLSVHQRVDILQAFLVNDTRRKIYCKNAIGSLRFKRC